MSLWQREEVQVLLWKTKPGIESAATPSGKKQAVNRHRS